MNDTCPVCGNAMENDICPVCGFDSAADVLAHPTLLDSAEASLSFREGCKMSYDSYVGGASEDDIIRRAEDLAIDYDPDAQIDPESAIFSNDRAIALLRPIGRKSTEALIEQCKANIEKFSAARDEARHAAEPEPATKDNEPEKPAPEKQKKSKKKIVVPIICGVVILAGAFTAINIVLNARYNEALESRSYIKLYELGNYRDSKEKADEFAKDDAELEIMRLRYAAVGDPVYYGFFQQNADAPYSKQPIRWKVLDIQDGKALLISEQILDGRPYDKPYATNKWESCTLRQWLNNDFLDEAFTSYEQDSIVAANVTADANPQVGSDQGSDTKDKVFLLSINEAEKYFASDYDRQCLCTSYASSHIEYQWNYAGWWLRTSGVADKSYLQASFVTSVGSIACHGRTVQHDLAVRPAMWVDIG